MFTLYVSSVISFFFLFINPTIFYSLLNLPFSPKKRISAHMSAFGVHRNI